MVKPSRAPPSNKRGTVAVGAHKVLLRHLPDDMKWAQLKDLAADRGLSVTFSRTYRDDDGTHCGVLEFVEFDDAQQMTSDFEGYEFEHSSTPLQVEMDSSSPGREGAHDTKPNRGHQPKTQGSVTVGAHKVMIKHVPTGMTWSQLKDVAVDRDLSVTFSRTYRDDNGIHCGLLEFSDASDAQQLVSEFDGYEFETSTRPLQVELMGGNRGLANPPPPPAPPPATRPWRTADDSKSDREPQPEKKGSITVGAHKVIIKYLPDDMTWARLKGLAADRGLSVTFSRTYRDDDGIHCGVLEFLEHGDAEQMVLEFDGYEFEHSETPLTADLQEGTPVRDNDLTSAGLAQDENEGIGSHRLVVHNLPLRMKWTELKALAEDHGSPVSFAKTYRDDSGKCCGILEFLEQVFAARAMYDLDGLICRGASLQVSRDRGREGRKRQRDEPARALPARSKRMR